MNMHWRRFKIREIPLENQLHFERWLRDRWEEKDEMLNQFHITGRLPTGVTSSTMGIKTIGGDNSAAGYIETHAKISQIDQVKQAVIFSLGFGAIWIVFSFGMMLFQSRVLV
jgi:hypothetical protein